MNFDLLLVILFILGNIALGIYSGRNIQTKAEYAIGSRDWSMAALISAIISCWISGDRFFSDLENIYSTGLHFMIASLGQVVGLLFIAYIFIPRMGEFLGDLSMAESLGKLYGKRIRIISAFVGSIASIGLIAIQFKIFGILLSNYFGIHPNISILLAGLIVISYCFSGGIRAVTITDMLQLFIFAAIFIPILSVVIWNEYIIVNSFSFEASSRSANFDFQSYLSGDRFWSLIWLFFFFIMPAFHPSLYQRIIMGKSLLQVKKACIISSLILFIILAGISWIGFLLFNLYPDISGNNLLYHIVENLPHSGLKAIIIMGIIGAAMSNSDSNLNSASILITHDILAPLGLEASNQLSLIKKIAILTGIVSLLLAYIEYDLFNMALISFAFIIPIASPSLLLAILGFRSSEKIVLIGMGAAVISIIFYALYYQTHIGDAILAGMMANFIFIFLSHYLLKSEGGWVGIKGDAYIVQARLERIHKLKNVFFGLREFSFKSNIEERGKIYPIFGFFALITTICSIYSSAATAIISKGALLFFYESMMFLSVSFIIYPIWPDYFKKSKYVPIFWNLSILYLFVICSLFFVFLTNFSEMQMIVLTLDLVALAIILKWQIALTMIIVGIFATSFLYENIMGIRISISNMASLEQQISYLIIIFSAFIFMFFKPRQDEEEITEERNIYLKEKISSQKAELSSLVNLKSEFLRNLNHELHTPVTGITSMAQGLLDNYKNMSEKEKYDCVKIIANSSEKFDAYTGSILDLAKLSSDNLELNNAQISLTKILYDSIDRNMRLHPNPNIDIIRQIENNIQIDGDEKYFRLVFDNLIFNALSYTQKGKINISLARNNDKITFSIEDQGMGIALDELYDIFSPFTVGSKTKSAACGKGIGLAICKKVIESYGGRIWAESDGRSGATFKFVICSLLPIRK